MFDPTSDGRPTSHSFLSFQSLPVISSALALFCQGTYEQLCIGAGLAMAMLAILCWTQPYKRDLDDFLATFCQLIIILNLLLAILLKGLESDEEHRE